MKEEGIKPKWLCEVEGAEIKAAARWLKGITKDICRLRISNKGFTVTFKDGSDTTAGKMHIPAAVKLAEAKEAGFSAGRCYNIFATFEKGEKAKLWHKGGDNQQKLLIKAGLLKWMHVFPGIEEAIKPIDFSKIEKGTVKLKVADIIEVVKINSGRKVAEKYNYIGFAYTGHKVRVYVMREGYNKKEEVEMIKTVEALESGSIEGVAIYSIELLNNILKKGIKTGSIRVGARVPLMAVIGIGKRSKAVAFVAPCIKSAWEEAIMGKASVKEEVEVNEEVTAKERRAKAQRAKLERDRDRVKVLRSGKVSNARTSEYGRGIRLEQIGSFYRIVIEKGADRMSYAKMVGYEREEEALKRYEWFMEVW